MKTGILLSGGIDSISLAYWKKPDVAFTIDYGQSPAEAEIKASKIVAELLNIEHHIIQVDYRNLGSGDLINEEAIGISPSSEWWPFRNQMLITLAAMKAVSLDVTEIMLASVKSDGFHKDGTAGFFARMNDLMCFQEGAIEISCPAIELSAEELVVKSKIPKEVLLWAFSCHKSTIACGNCRGCNKYYATISNLGYI